MSYLSVAETAKKWGVSERSVRGYCANGKIQGAVLKGKTWYLPENAQKPERINKRAETLCGYPAAFITKFRST